MRFRQRVLEGSACPTTGLPPPAPTQAPRESTCAQRQHVLTCPCPAEGTADPTQAPGAAPHPGRSHRHSCSFTKRRAGPRRASHTGWLNTSPTARQDSGQAALPSRPHPVASPGSWRGACSASPVHSSSPPRHRPSCPLSITKRPRLPPRGASWRAVPSPEPPAPSVRGPNAPCVQLLAPRFPRFSLARTA